MNFKANIRFYSLFWIAAIAGIILLTASSVAHQKSEIASGLEVRIMDLDNGHHMLTAEDISQELEDVIGTVDGRYIEDLDVLLIEELLYTNPFVLSAEVYVSAKEILHVDVHQRQPLLRVYDKSGHSYYLDKDCQRVPVSAHYTARVPVVNGHIPAFQEELPEVVSNAYQLVRKVAEDRFLSALVEQVYVDKNAEMMVIPKLGTNRIVFGNVEMLDDKLERLKVFYEKGIPATGWDKYQEINLKYAGQVVCRKKGV